MKPFKNLALLQKRHQAEQAAASLPGLMAQAERAAASILSGAHTQRKAGTGEKFWQYREYDPADRPQDIDWRQSAKGDRLFVREKEWQTTQTALIWCQTDENMDYHADKALPTKKDTAIVIALALGILLARAGERIAALESRTYPGRSELSLQTLGEDILSATTESLPSAVYRKIPRGSNLLLVGDFLAPLPVIAHRLDELSVMADSGMLVQVLDPAELSLPYDGRVMFEQTGSAGEQHLIDNVESIRTAYRERLDAHIKALKEECRRRRWHWLLHRTDRPVAETLFDAWMMMAPDSFHYGGGA